MAGDLYDTAQELAAMRTAASTRVLHRINCRVAVEAEIQHIPYLKDTGKVDKNGAVVFDVPPSLRVLSYDHVTGKADFFPVTSFTVDPGKTSVAVSTQRGRSVVVSDNESLVAYNHNTGALEKVAPAHAAGRLVPTIKKLPEIGDLHTFDFGWMCGAFAGDGFVTGAVIGFTKLDGATREFFNSTLRKHIGAVGSVVQRSLGYADVAGTGKLGNSCKPHCNIGTEVLFFECEFYTTPHSQRTGRAALYKKLPNFLNWSMPARIGLLSGLLDTDGSVALNKSRSKPQLLINYATSSAVLRDDVIRLCRSLGINASFSTTLPREGRRQKAPSFTISISSADLRDSGVNLQLRDGAKQSLLDEHLPLVADNNYDFVPVPVDVVQLFCSNKGPFVNDRRARSNWATLRSKQAHYKVARWMALRDAKFLVDVNAPIVKDWLRLIQNRNISWDVVKSVEQAGTITTYDLGVPDTKVFAVNGGLIIQDTVNIHVPSSQEAVDDVKNKLLPSKNLFFTGNFETHYEPMQDYTAGLYLAGKLDPGQKAVTFATVDEAKAAYARGLINARTPIRVLS
jgi:hypothetical protein